MKSTSHRPGRRPGRALRTHVTALLFLAPALVAFGVFKFWPVVLGIKSSLFNVRPYLGNEYVGAANYRAALTDPALRSAVSHSVIDTIAVVAVSTVVGLGLAILFNTGSRLHRYLRAFVFLPGVMAAGVVSFVWQVLYYPDHNGAINRLLSLVGVGPLKFISSPHQSLASVIVLQIWLTVPFAMAIFTAGLMSIDDSLYEAAAVDGASPWQKFRAVTLPGVRGPLYIVTMIGIIRTLRAFTEVWTLTGGGPGGSSDTIVTYIYRVGLQGGNRIGYASAIATMLLVVTVVLTSIQYYFQRRAAR